MGSGAAAKGADFPQPAGQFHGLFICTFKQQPEALTDRDDIVWTMMVEKAIVHRDGGITVVFYNGAEIQVECKAA